MLSAPGTEAISGTHLRSALLNDEPLPDWYLRDAVQLMLREEMAHGRSVFWEPEPDVAAAVATVAAR